MQASLFAAPATDERQAPLAGLEVLAIDCQATGAAPRGHILELGWARIGSEEAPRQTRLVKLPEHSRIPPAVRRLTGISHEMAQGGVSAHAAWSELLAAAASLPQQPAPAVAHFARFEAPFLRTLAGGPPPLDLVCTHDIARRLLPGLPRLTLRALAGYFGRAVGPLRRSEDHVAATAFVWRELVHLLEGQRVLTWGALHEWLATPLRASRRPRRTWPMPRELRLSLPDTPGIYRMLRTGGAVLYVGKASSLRHRVNSYFRKQRGIHERVLEMLAQARDLSFEVAPTAVEAALLECDEIKRHQPPYNIALLAGARSLWFAPPHLGERGPTPTRRCRLGPFSSSETLDQFASLVRGSRFALGRDHASADAATFAAGHAHFRAAHPELALKERDPRLQLLRVGARLWRDGRRDRDQDLEGVTANVLPLLRWSAADVQLALEWVALRAALARRRASWFTRLADAAIAWHEPGMDHARLLVLEQGDITRREWIEPGAVPPLPPGHQRTAAARRAAFTVARFDRVRVLTTELKRLAAEGAAVAVRFDRTPPVTGQRLARALSWI